ncbi:hypothetical protein JQX09_05400 [Sulfitobacter pseudonitzschiae]|uniref:Co-chaperone DjlA N-terminal domain-containing protein n=1 Tax=Pseudosulfitobacter pseudonitzschiae TaxID=1402135 RepID=A0A9Q2NFV2_9RHOB|nr:hypothetical protein [Pseudosulfitobacter pseudonitzschiae]MBM2291332.1 hypothetical protein [Pseudosulfitobacter pseudonitzschiae]MBM2296250.1 hypothetical protein [Pseudosulfitobacter pseudonitzschiae]MBM2301163.1 hypothetical protein [Pseudosulfitobacter pseudonitzschiae]MBM2310947.1 hypothetical protein [Pseudosulfitobacter pseudonitzschiae]MBM2315860.1 hypothetical protein [Pseudosulfitobacter pseudonitzschiae]
MPILLGLIAVGMGVYFFLLRVRRGSAMVAEVIDMASDARAAARRFGFKRRTNVHPVDSIDDPNLALGALATAFLELDDLPTRDARAALNLQLRTHGIAPDAEAAQEIAVLGHWFVQTCGSAQAAVTRLARRLYKLDGGASFPTLMTVLQATAQASDSGLSKRQIEALDEIKRAFRLT